VYNVQDCNFLYHKTVRPVVYEAIEGWHFTHMWKAWPHYLTNGGLGHTTLKCLFFVRTVIKRSCISISYSYTCQC